MSLLPDEDKLTVTVMMERMKADFSSLFIISGKVVHGETTVAHAVLNGMQYYHQDWAHAAAHVIVPPLRLDPNTPSYLMGLLGKYVCCTQISMLYCFE